MPTQQQVFKMIPCKIGLDLWREGNFATFDIQNNKSETGHNWYGKREDMLKGKIPTLKLKKTST